MQTYKNANSDAFLCGNKSYTDFWFGNVYIYNFIFKVTEGPDDILGSFNPSVKSKGPIFYYWGGLDNPFIHGVNGTGA